MRSSQDVLDRLPTRREVLKELSETYKRARRLRTLDRLLCRIESELERADPTTGDRQGVMARLPTRRDVAEDLSETCKLARRLRSLDRLLCRRDREREHNQSVTAEPQGVCDG